MNKIHFTQVMFSNKLHLFVFLHISFAVQISHVGSIQGGDNSRKCYGMLLILFTSGVSNSVRGGPEPCRV